MRNSASLCTWPGPNATSTNGNWRKTCSLTDCAQQPPTPITRSGSSRLSFLASCRWETNRSSAFSRIEQVLKRIRSASARSGDLAVADRLEHALHPLGVVLVHLAAERRDVERLHGSGGYRAVAGRTPALRVVWRGREFRVGLLVLGMRAQTTPTAISASRSWRRVSTVSSCSSAARGAGVRSRRRSQRRVAAGRLHRLHRGVYAVGHTVLSRNGAYLAAVLACGPHAVLSHRSAAALWGLRPSDAPRIDVTVPHTSGFRTTRTIVVHRPLRTPDPMTHAGVPVTTPGRTLADLALALPRRQLENAVEAAERLQPTRRHRRRPPRRQAAPRGSGRRPPLHPQRARGRVPRALRPLRHPAPAREQHPRRRRGRLLLARAAADRRDRRPRPPQHACGVRARPRA